MARRKDQPDSSAPASAAATDVTSAGATGASPALKRSRRRRKDAELTGTESAERAVKARSQLTPRWWITTMVTLMVLGLVWIVVFYLSSAQYPVPGWDNWNLVAGFGLVLVGFAMTTRWR